jgi:hypothetical protein
MLGHGAGAVKMRPLTLLLGQSAKGVRRAPVNFV